MSDLNLPPEEQADQSGPVADPEEFEGDDSDPRAEPGAVPPPD